MKNRTRVIMALVLFGFLGVALRLVVVQGVGRGSYAQLSLKEHQRILLVHGERGVVLDRNGDVLASNRSLPGLVCDPTVLKKHSSVSRVARELSGPLGISPAHLSLILNKKSRFVWIRHDLFPQTVSEIKELRIPGLYVMNEERRFYPGGVQRCLFTNTDVKNATTHFLCSSPSGSRKEKQPAPTARATTLKRYPRASAVLSQDLKWAPWTQAA